MLERTSTSPVLVIMAPDATPLALQRVMEAVEAHGATAHPHRNGGAQLYVAVTGLGPGAGLLGLEAMEGVEQVLPVTKAYIQASRQTHPADSIVDLSGIPVGGKSLCIIAGPCAVETREQTLSIAEQVAAAGAHALRGGAYKPRTSPYSFQGLGPEGLEILAEARERTGLRVVTEAMEIAHLPLVAATADAIQIGARNMQNFSLLSAAGEMGKPVLLKRGMSATLSDWLLAAEYILNAGNPNVILCERGIRTFSDHARNTLDLSVIPAAKQETHLPILVDPSHGTGRRSLVPAMARAAIACGADGLLIEVHGNPAEARSDGQQAILPEEFAALMVELEMLAGLMGRSLQAPLPPGGGVSEHAGHQNGVESRGATRLAGSPTGG